MKTIYKIITVCILLVSTGMFAQNSKTIVNPEKSGKLQALDAQELLESVVFVQDFTPFQGRKVGARPITIEIVNYHPTKKLLPAYMINGLEYCDNGKYNDKVAGDGIFTSVQNVTVKNLPKGTGKKYTASPALKHQSANKSEIKFGCKVRTVTCPETNWWNSCWPLSSPCTCVEFYDCEVEISIEF